MAAAEGTSRFEERLGDPGIQLDGRRMRWTHGRTAPLERHNAASPNLWRLRESIAIARLIVDALGNSPNAAGPAESAPMTVQGADPYLSMRTHLENLEADWKQHFRAVLQEVGQAHLAKTNDSNPPEMQAEWLTRKCDAWLEENHPAAPTAAARKRLAEGAVDLAWAEGRVDALLSGPPLVTLDTWRGLNQEAEFGARAAANGARAVLLSLTSGDPQAGYNSIERGRNNTDEALHHGGLARQAEADARERFTEVYMAEHHRLGPPPPRAPEMSAPTAQVVRPAQRTAEPPRPAPAAVQGMHAFEQLLGPPGADGPQEVAEWSHRYHAPLERSSSEMPLLWLMRERIAVARLLVDGLASDADGAGARHVQARDVEGRIVQGVDPGLSLRAHLTRLEADWERHFSDALVSTATIQLRRAEPREPYPRTEYEPLVVTKRDERLAKNPGSAAAPATPVPTAAAGVALSWAAAQVDALITGPRLVPRDVWRDWNLKADFGGRAVLGETRAELLRRRGRSSKMSLNAADRNARRSRAYGEAVDGREAQIRADNSAEYIREFLDRNAPERTVRQTAPAATLTEEQKAQILNYVGATGRGMSNVPAVAKGLHKWTGLALAADTSHGAEVRRIMQGLARRGVGRELRREPGE